MSSKSCSIRQISDERLGGRRLATRRPFAAPQLANVTRRRRRWAPSACSGLGARRSRRCFHHSQRLPDEGRNIAGLA
jgi:hypothetical protein